MRAFPALAPLDRPSFSSPEVLVPEACISGVLPATGVEAEPIVAGAAVAAAAGAALVVATRRRRNRPRPA